MRSFGLVPKTENGNAEITAVKTRRLLFLPGAGGDPAFWRPVGEALPLDGQKTYLGWPGLGNQPADPAVRGLDDLVRLVEEQLGDEPVDLLAQSMGGVVALRVALKHPTKVRCLVLAATSGGIDVKRFGASDWRAEYRAAFPNAAPWIMEPVADISAELSNVTQRALLLWGDADPISPVAVGRQLWQLLPHAMLQIIPDADHNFVHERPADIVEVISRHLE
jgi:pimeloyl-ACP methyl ester carboxylesterase